MKKDINRILIAIVIVLTILSLPGASERLKNERSSGTICLAADVAAFRIAADKVKSNVFDEIGKLRDYGLNTVLISNKTIRDYESSGQAEIHNVYEIRNLALSGGPDPGTFEAYPNSLFIIPSDEYYEEIRTRLLNRFREQDLIFLDYNGRKAIVINAELDERVGVNMGFDETLIEEALMRGFRVALSMQNENFGNTAFVSEIEDIFQKYEISYVETNSFEFPGYGGGQDKAMEAIIASGAVLMLKADFGTVIPAATKGLPEYLKLSGFNAQRTFFLRDYLVNSRITTPRDYYFRMLRAAVDRGNRFFVVTPLTANRKLFSQALEDTGSTLSIFYNRLNDTYDFDSPVTGADFKETGSIFKYFSALALVFAALLIVINAFPAVKAIYILYAVFLLMYAFVGIAAQSYLEKVSALLGTIIYPSLFGLVLAKTAAIKPVASGRRLAAAVGAYFGAAFASAACTAVNLSSPLNYLGISTFTGVKLAFVAPLLFHALVSAGNGNDFRGIAGKAVKIAGKPVTYLALAVTGVCAFAAYLYVIRSGNDSGNLVGTFEIRIREFLEDLVLARPRTKELLIGYPAFSLFLYFCSVKTAGWLRYIAGAGAMIGLISVANTFSHVTGYLGIAAERSLYALAIGLLISFAVILLFRIIYKYFSGKQLNVENE